MVLIYAALSFFIFVNNCDASAQSEKKIQSKQTQSAQAAKPKPVFKLGIENNESALWLRLKSSKAVGIVTNHTGKDQQGKRSLDILLQRGIKIKKIFVPEHGFDGLVHAEKDVGNSVDPKTNIPIVSLYAQGTGKRIGEKTLSDLDIIIFDIQDSGMRHYTYVSTLMSVLRAAGEFNKQLFVFDRPNPLGARMEGPIVEKGLNSFISCAPIPLRHGMTVGELARYFNNTVVEKKAQLRVIPMLNYQRSAGLSMKYTQLSPNLPTKESCYGYSMLGMLGEVRPCDIGIGTGHAMEIIALPQSKGLSGAQWAKLNEKLKPLGIHTVHTSYYSERKKEQCNGLKLKFPHINKASSFQGLLTILKFFHEADIQLTFSRYFDIAIGSKKVQEYITGKLSYAVLQEEIETQLMQFNKRVQSDLLYYPGPKVATMLKSNTAQVTNK